MFPVLIPLRQRITLCFHALHDGMIRWMKPRSTSLLLGTIADLAKGKSELLVENASTPRPTGQSWQTFLRTHGGEIWACDFLQLTDLYFRSLFAFFIIELKSRKVIHVGVTRSPTDTWTARTAAGGDSLWTHTEVSHARS